MDNRSRSIARRRRGQLLLSPEMSRLRIVLMVASIAVMTSWSGERILTVEAKQSIKHKNIYGSPLKPCSTTGMAVTGSTGNGYCDHNMNMGEEHNYDEFAHTICIDFASFGGRKFFAATNQPDWSDSENRELPCMEAIGSDEHKVAKTEMSADETMTVSSCPIVHWCTSAPDYASYTETIGGCEALGHIVCESTNAKVVTDYEEAAANGDEKALEALACLKLKCWL